jgi:hypothetical protein
MLSLSLAVSNMDLGREVENDYGVRRGSSGGRDYHRLVLLQSQRIGADPGTFICIRPVGVFVQVESG